MTNKSRIVIIIVAALALILAATGFAYSRYRKNIAEKASGGPHTVANKEAQAERYRFDDILDVRQLFGKTAEESGIDSKYFSDGSRLEFEGKLFGKEAHGYLEYYDNDTDSLTNPKTATSADIYCYGMSFDEALQKLSEIFGEPTASGEEPYAEANGGAVQWAEFVSESTEVKLSSAENYDYILLNLYDDGWADI